MEDEPELVLHVWPALWDLPSFTPACLASILYLQLTMPGKFIVEESRNPDLSPDGQLPYLTHGLVCIASFPSIVKYVDGLERTRHRRSGDEEGEEELDREDGAPDLSMLISTDRVKRAQEMAWMAYVSASLGDLVACSLFTLRHNYFDFVRPALAELFPVPQRCYMPDRLRETYAPRLEAVGLWSLSAEEAEEEKRKKKDLLGIAGRNIVDEAQEAIGKAKVLEIARTALDIISRLLGNGKWFLDEPEPGALDAFVAAHILLLTVPPHPNDTLRMLVVTSYPSLLTHGRRMQVRTLSPGRSSLQVLAASLSSSFEVVDSHLTETEQDTYAPLIVRSEPQPSFSEVLSSLAVPFCLRNAVSFRKRRLKSKVDKEYDRMRWAWYGLAALGIIGWFWSTGIRFVNPEYLERMDDFERVGPGDEAEGEEEEDDEDDHEI